MRISIGFALQPSSSLKHPRFTVSRGQTFQTLTHEGVEAFWQHLQLEVGRWLQEQDMLTVDPSYKVASLTASDGDVSDTSARGNIQSKRGRRPTTPKASTVISQGYRQRVSSEWAFECWECLVRPRVFACHLVLPLVYSSDYDSVELSSSTSV